MPEPGEHQYFIGIGLPAKENKFFLALKTRFHPKHKLTSPPHITLKPPFLFPNQPLLLSKLASWAKDQAPFTATFKKVGLFKQPKYATVFLSPQSSQTFKLMEKSLTQKITWLPKSKNFIPHLTIASRIPLDKAGLVKSQIRDMQIKLQLQVNHITLFRRQPPGSWVAYKTFEFQSEVL